MTRLGETAVVSGLVGSNDVIDRLRRTGEHVLKLHTPKRVIWHYSDTLAPIPTPVAERLTQKGILIAREPSGQSWELAEGWR